MKENIKVQGYVLLDVDVVALNNAGKDTMSNFDNAVKTKSIYKNGLNYVYVSGQAWRFWWREALQKNVGWTLSPVIRDKNIAFTTANPLTYPDDDIFGYMRAATEEYEEKGKKKLQDAMNFGITHFIDLTEEGELIPYAEHIPSCSLVKHIRFPIHDTSVPSSCESMLDLLKIIVVR